MTDHKPLSMDDIAQKLRSLDRRVEFWWASESEGVRIQMICHPFICMEFIPRNKYLSDQDAVTAACARLYYQVENFIASEKVND